MTKMQKQKNLTLDNVFNICFIIFFIAVIIYIAGLVGERIIKSKNNISEYSEYSIWRLRLGGVPSLSDVHSASDVLLAIDHGTSTIIGIPQQSIFPQFPQYWVVIYKDLAKMNGDKCVVENYDRLVEAKTQQEIYYICPGNKYIKYLNSIKK